jgi:hypothetical protein
MTTAATVERLLETVDRFARRLNSLESSQRESPPFDRTPRPRPASPEQAYQDRCHAEGVLKEVVSTDDTGRRIRRFYGDPEKCWQDFKSPVRRVIGWNSRPR